MTEQTVEFAPVITGATPPPVRSSSALAAFDDAPVLPGWGWPMADPEDPTPIFDQLTSETEESASTDEAEGGRHHEVAADDEHGRGGPLPADQEDGGPGAEVLAGEPEDQASGRESGV